MNTALDTNSKNDVNNGLKTTLDTDNFVTEFNEVMYDNFNEGYYIGIMSGTSLDAMDLVVVSFNYDEDADELLANGLPNNVPSNVPSNENIDSSITLVATLSKNFAPNLREVLLALCQPNGSSVLANSELQRTEFTQTELTQMSELDWFGWASRVYAEFVSDAVLEILTSAELSADNILAIGCHGQTVRHRPQHGFTLQLVDPNIIAERTAITVITDFRRRDMAVGGQGAPLVPAFHQALFTSNDTRVLLNLGGIANITVLPSNMPASQSAKNSTTLSNQDSKNQQVIGYDTGPANLLLDAWISRHTDSSFDENGNFGRSGTIINELLEQLLRHPYFALTAPKSTGREDFNIDWLDVQLDIFTKTYADISYSTQDIQATITELTVISASREIANQSKSGHLYVCGGGAFNHYILERLAHHLPDWTVNTTQELGLDPTWVEAIAFAWLAQQTIMGKSGNLPQVTGASKEVVLGTVCFA